MVVRVMLSIGLLCTSFYVQGLGFSNMASVPALWWQEVADAPDPI